MSVIEKATNADPEKVYNASKKLLPGASERDIVYSGLEEVMSSATQEVIEIAEAKGLDLRTAAYVLAITRLNDYYITRGIDIWFDFWSYILFFIHLFFLYRILSFLNIGLSIDLFVCYKIKKNNNNTNNNRLSSRKEFLYMFLIIDVFLLEFLVKLRLEYAYSHSNKFHYLKKMIYVLVLLKYYYKLNSNLFYPTLSYIYWIVQ